MPVSEPKRKLNKNEILEILRRNARLFKDEPDFVNYIVDLAMYMIENYLEKESSLETRERTFKAAKRDLEQVYHVFEKFGTSTKPQPKVRMCPVCGCPTEGKRKCPNCDAMAF